VKTKKVPLANPEAFTQAFLAMWSGEGVNKVADLGCYVDNIRDESELLRAVCMHILEIPLVEYLHMMRKVPELDPKSWQYNKLRSEIEFRKKAWDSGEIVGHLHTEIINLTIAEYNRTI
jgi:hypothetical protein